MTLKKTSYSLILTGIAIALFFSVNFIFDNRTVSFDLTENRLFSLSPQSYTLMDNLEHDITIYGLYQTGFINKLIDELLRRYSSASDRIRIEYIDPVRNPDLVSKYEYQGKIPSENSLIISGNGRFKVLSEADMFEIGLDVQRRQQVQSLIVERRLTGALLYVNGGNSQIIAALKGHGETALPAALTKSLELENYELRELDTGYLAEIPDDIDVIVLNLPERDIQGTEADIIFSFLERGGRALFLVSPIFSGTPNLNKLMSSYGIRFTNILISENDPQYYAQQPLFLLPRIKHHEILEPLISAEMRVVSPYSQYIEIQDLNDPTLLVTTLLETSDSASLIDDAENNPTGPFSVAAALMIEEKNQSSDNNGKGSRIIIISSGAVSDANILRDVPGNANFILNGFNWLAERDNDMAIRPKSLLSFRLDINRAQSLIYSGIVVILIPLLILGAGFVIWLRRRRL